MKINSKKSLKFSFFLFTFASLLYISFTHSIDRYSILIDDDQFVSEERVLELFKRWKEKHGKVYEDEDEIKTRLDNFKKNLKYVTEKNTKNDSRNVVHRVGLNKFGDMSNDEFRRVYMSKVRKPIGKKNVLKKGELGNSCDDAPSRLDWRKKGVVTHVKDQGSCGSCWSFSSTGAMEGINGIVTGDLITLSEQELIDCDSTNDGCDGGYMDYAFEWVINNGGIDTEIGYPYTAQDGTCNSTKEESKVVSIDGYTDVGESDISLFCAVAQQPVSVGIDGSTMDFQLYTSGIYDGDCSSEPDDIDHAVLIVGYGSEDGEDYWIVKNSWGTSWGIDGYILIKRNTDLEYGVCAINAMASYPTKQSSSSPSPVSPPPSGQPPPPPPPPVSPPPPPPPPPSPSPTKCGDFTYCSSDETCCCIFEFFDYCLVYGCCGYENGVCCTGNDYCCPSDYPVCDVEEGLCLKSSGDYLGVAASMAVSLDPPSYASKKQLVIMELDQLTTTTSSSSSPSRHPPGGRISPYRNAASRSPIREVGFLGTPKNA